MLDRSLQAAYAPGSPFKLVQALIGLEEKVITPRSSFYCYHGYRYGNAEHNFMGCHCGIVGAPIALKTSIKSVRDRANKPAVSNEGAKDFTPSKGNSPELGLKPKIPQ